MDLTLVSLLLRATARAAPPCATLAALGQRQPVGIAVTGQLAQVDQGVHVADAGHDGDRVQAAHDEGADAVGRVDEVCTPVMMPFSNLVNTGPMAARSGNR